MAVAYSHIDLGHLWDSGKTSCSLMCCCSCKPANLMQVEGCRTSLHLLLYKPCRIPIDMIECTAGYDSLHPQNPTTSEKLTTCSAYLPYQPPEAMKNPAAPVRLVLSAVCVLRNAGVTAGSREAALKVEVCRVRSLGCPAKSRYSRVVS